MTQPDRDVVMCEELRPSPCTPEFSVQDHAPGKNNLVKHQMTRKAGREPGPNINMVVSEM